MGTVESEYLPLISNALKHQRDIAVGNIAVPKGEEAEEFMVAFKRNRLETWLGTYLENSEKKGLTILK